MRPLTWLVLLLLAAGPLRAQVLDDSTKLLYGPKTTLVVREANVLRNRPDGAVLDTSITGMHNSRNWYYDSTFQQDLGNVALASRRLLWAPNTQLGARFGRDAYNKYFRDVANIPYYDTRSPYTFFRFVQGGVGEQVFEGQYTRSVKKAVNVGIAYERFGANKQLGTTLSRDQQVTHSGVLIFARYQTKDERYHLLLNYYVARHRAIDQGGIRPGTADGDTLSKLFDYRSENVWLRQAQTEEHRDQFHLAHTYKLLGQGVTAFHVLDWRRQYDKFTDNFTANPADRDFHAYILRNQSKTDDRAEYKQVENTVGLLGNLNWAEYRLYARHRNARLSTRSSFGSPEALQAVRLSGYSADSTYNQIFLGGNLAFRWRELFDVEAAGEYKLFDELWLRGRLRFGPLTGEVLHSSYAPTLTQQQYAGNHQQWLLTDADAPTKNTTVDQLTVSLDQRLGAADARFQQRIQGSVAFVTLTNLVYYGQGSYSQRGYRPYQLDGTKALLVASARHRLRYGILRLDNQLIFTQGGDGAGLRIPKVVANAKVYLEGPLLKKVLYCQTGIEAYAQSRYMPYDYSPTTQQFFVQDHFTSRTYPVIDVFFAADIKTVSFFLKMAYINQGIYRHDGGFFPGPDGYFPTPYYTGNPRSFQLGLKWNFFD